MKTRITDHRTVRHSPPDRPVERLLEKERSVGAALKFEDIVGGVAGACPKVMTEGAINAGARSCGRVAGLIHDVPTVQALLDRVMAEGARADQRPAGAVRGGLKGNMS